MAWYDEKVRQMREMGFEDESASRIALTQTGGNIADAIEKLVANESVARGSESSERSDREGRSSQQGGSGGDAEADGKGLAPIFRASQPPPSSQLSFSQKPRNLLSAKKGNQKAPARNSTPKSFCKPDNAVSQVRLSNFGVKQEQSAETLPVARSTDAHRAVISEPPIVLQDDESPRKSVVPPPPPAKRRKVANSAPLAERMRPEVWSSFVGQEGVATMLKGFSEQSRVPSIILWGPPGCGKTTLGKMLARLEGYAFVSLSAVSAGLPEVRKAVQEAQSMRSLHRKRTLLFLDEIHRFNKVQQDAFLPHVESGLLTLVGATTENPSFSLNRALLSRAKVLVLDKLCKEEVKALLRQALRDEEHGVACALHELPSASGEQQAAEDEGESERMEVEVAADVLEALAGMADGDARLALNTLELAVLHAARNRPKQRQEDVLGAEDRAGESEESQGSVALSPRESAGSELRDDLDTPPSNLGRSGQRQGRRVVVRVELEDVHSATQRTSIAYDAAGDEHYTIISAFHKSVRGSDPQAAVYWLARMLCGGEKPEYIARRMIRIASEDVGLADTSALQQAVAAHQACQAVGMPECNLALTQCAVYLALAPKCTLIYQGWKAAEHCVRSQPLYPVPLHLRNANSKVLSDLGWGVGYKYNPGYPDGAPEQTYLPPELHGQAFVPLHGGGREDSPPL